MADKIEGYLEVGTNGKGEVVLNLPHDMTGHIIFSPNQARQLAILLRRKADEAWKETNDESQKLEPGYFLEGD